MARNANVSITNEWTQLTNADATAVTFLNMTGDDIIIMGTSSATAPTGYDGPQYPRMTGERNVYLSDMFPGVTGVVRLWARCTSLASGAVFVSHA